MKYTISIRSKSEIEIFYTVYYLIRTDNKYKYTNIVSCYINFKGPLHKFSRDQEVQNLFFINNGDELDCESLFFYYFKLK